MKIKDYFLGNYRNDRFMGVVLFALFCFTLTSIYQLKVSFSPDPLGPKNFPLIISILGIISAVFLFFFPEKNKQFLSKSKVVQLVFLEMILLFYAMSFEYLGFTISTAIVVVCISTQLNFSFKKSITYALLLACGSYFLFYYILEINLPLGEIIEHIIE